MDIDVNAVLNNLRNFAEAYGLEISGKALAREIISGDRKVVSAGVLLRDPLTKKPLISCEFPVDRDVARDMIWVMIDNRNVEAVPICSTELTANKPIKYLWTKLKEMIAGEQFLWLEQSAVKLKAHRSFCKQGVIDRFLPNKGYGFIRRTRNGVFFSKSWCNLKEIQEGQEVSFIPVISRTGLQARAVRDVAPKGGMN